jgi:hypothetical protein
MGTKTNTDQQTQTKPQKATRLAFPHDVKLRWVNVTRRLQAACQSKGLSLVSITVLVDEDGLPVLWLEPDVRRIEPKKSAQEIVEMLAAKQGVKKFEKI